jgi:hypothetical protein
MLVQLLVECFHFYTIYTVCIRVYCIFVCNVNYDCSIIEHKTL